MDFQWEFFENLNEIVYVTDIETENLIYMNARLRKMLGYHNDEYVGKKCYEVLQDRSSVCEFCTNNKLKKGEFYEWTYTNPLMNKTFLIKDTIVTFSGKEYRLEMAIDIDVYKTKESDTIFENSDGLVNECIQLIYDTPDVNEAINNLLKFLGEKFKCARSYIFEKNSNGCFDNTYEWCAEDIVPQKELLQNEPEETISWWIDLFKNKQIVVIENIEDIKDKYTLAYATLKQQDIVSLVTAPIHFDDNIFGFIGVDNPNIKYLKTLKQVLNTVSYFVQSFLKRRDSITRLEDLSYHDPMTGALNRNALLEFYESQSRVSSIGVVCCDISGLRDVNNSGGYVAGDKLILDCYSMLARVMPTERIYRTGADEFIIIAVNKSKFEFNSIVDRLKNEIKMSTNKIAVGSIWSDSKPINIGNLVERADYKMYEDKIKQNNSIIQRRKNSTPKTKLYQIQKGISTENKFLDFITNNTFDPESMFESITFRNSAYYLYFGDLQTNQFYVSDNMRDRFGFEDNVVPNLLMEWETRISTPEHLALYRHDIDRIFKEKKTIHDLRYQIKDKYGNNIWIRCCGILKWNKERTKPIFFSGRVSCQDNDFVVDAITNFPREHAAMLKINEICKSKDKIDVIGFCLNNFTEINETKGRYFGNLILQQISNRLSDEFGSQMFFYRLDGMRFMAIISPSYDEYIDRIIDKMRSIIEYEYRNADISVHHPCAFGVLTYESENSNPHMLLENVITLISAAKALPNNKYVEHSLENMKKVKKMANIALQLGQDVANGMDNFRIVVQPIVTADKNELIKGEALLRWKYNEQNISPAVFIPMLEKSKIILPVGKWVFEQSVRICKRLLSYEPRFKMSFNVSYLQILDDDFIRFIERTLKKYHIDGSHFIAELTETHFDENPEKLSEFVEGCKQLGIQIALDDFGNGYSSLGLLLKYPASVVKLDRSLLAEVTESEDKMNFIRSIVYACHQFGKTVCVEGVETEEENNIVKNTGCDMIQGYFHYKPTELADLYELLMNINK